MKISCPLKQHLEKQFRQTAIKELDAEPFKHNDDDFQRFPQRPKFTKPWLNLDDRQDVIDCFRKQTTFTNDPKLVPEKYFLEEELDSNISYDFFRVISCLGSVKETDMNKFEADDIKLKIKRKFHLDIDAVVKTAEDIIQKQEEIVLDYLAIKKLLLQASSMSQLEVHAAALYLKRV